MSEFPRPKCLRLKVRHCMFTRYNIHVINTSNLSSLNSLSNIHSFNTGTYLNMTVTSNDHLTTWSVEWVTEVYWKSLLILWWKVHSWFFNNCNLSETDIYSCRNTKLVCILCFHSLSYPMWTAPSFMSFISGETARWNFVQSVNNALDLTLGKDPTAGNAF